MSLIVPWIVFPLVLGTVALGCGLLLERAAHTRLHGALLIPAGIATMIVADEIVTASDSTARLSVPVVVALAVAGLAASPRWRRNRIDRSAAAAAAVTYATYGAPVIATGAATFLGYVKLDDTATWFAFTDHAMRHGANVGALPPSTFSTLLDVNLGKGYPIGAFFPLGVGNALTRTDVAWVFQPYLAFLGALLCLCIYVLLAPVVRPRWQRGVIAAVSAQPAILYGYSLWGGVKELVAATLLATTAALLSPLLQPDGRAQAALPVAIACSAVLASLSLDAVVWLAPVVAVGAVALLRSVGRVPTLHRLAGLALGALLFSAPALAGGFGFANIDSAGNELLRKDTLGNLIRPLSSLQVFGIWLSGDFRIPPQRKDVTYVLIAVVALAAAYGAVVVARRRAWPLIAYAFVTLGSAAVVARASPWVGGKALAAAAPVPVALALVGAAVIASRGRRVEGALLALAICGGVVCSNALAYHAVTVAPRDQLVELQRIGVRFASDGPTLLSEYSPYGARHFLRALDAETPSELRVRPVYLRNGAELTLGQTADLDAFRLDGILVYRTIVLRRSGTESRPPSVYDLVWKGRYYEVWQRPESAPTILEHLPLGSRYQAGGIAPCPAVRRLARIAGPTGMLATVSRLPAISVELAQPYATGTSPYGEDPHVAYLSHHVSLVRDVSVRAGGRYDIWLGGTFMSRLRILVDGRVAADRRNEINWPGQFTPLATLSLGAGMHRLELRYAGPDAMHPGSGAAPINGAGPIVLARDTADVPVQLVAPARATQLCGRRLDWIEAVR